FAAIQARVTALATRLGKPGFAIDARPLGDGTPHIEVTDAYYFVSSERGEEYERRRTTDLDELLYWIIAGLTSQRSWDYEVRHRIRGEDARRQAFAEQIELLAILSPAWAHRQKAEQAEILSRHPFRDG